MQPLLSSFNPKNPIVVQTDGSSGGVCCCLSQQGKPVAFASKSLNKIIFKLKKRCYRLAV